MFDFFDDFSEDFSGLTDDVLDSLIAKEFANITGQPLQNLTQASGESLVQNPQNLALSQQNIPMAAPMLPQGNMMASQGNMMESAPPQRAMSAAPQAAPEQAPTGFGHEVGVAARGVARGLGGLPDLFALPTNAVLAMKGEPTLSPNEIGLNVGGQKAESFSDLAGQAFDALTGDKYQPKTFGQKALSTAAEFAGGGASFAKAGATKLSPFAQKYLAPQTLKDYLSFAGAGAGLEFGKEIAPDNPATQIGASLLSAAAAGPALSGMGKSLNFATHPISSTQNALASTLGVNPAKVTAFEKAGMQPSLSNISDKRWVGTVENTLKELPLVGAPIDDIARANQANIGKYGAGLTQDEAGILAQSGLKNYANKGNEIAGKLGENVNRHFGEDEGIAINKVGSFIAANKPNLKTSEAIAKYDNSNIGKVFSEFEGLQAKYPNGIPKQDLTYLRQNIDNEITTFGKYGSQEQRLLKGMRSNIQSDITEAAKAKGPQAARDVERFNKFYSALAAKKEGVINDLTANKSATEAFKSVMANARVDARLADDVLKTLKPEQKQVFTQSLIKELGMTPQNEFNPAVLATNFKKLEPQAQSIVLASFPQETQAQFRSMIDAIDGIKFTDNLANKSRTAYTQLLGGAGSSAIGALTGGPAGALLAPVTTLGAARVASSELFANPKFINWIGKAPALSKAGAATAGMPATEQAGILQKLARVSPQIAKGLSGSSDTAVAPTQEAILNNSTQQEDLAGLGDEALNKAISEERANISGTMAGSRQMDPSQLDKMTDDEFNNFLNKQIKASPQGQQSVEGVTGRQPTRTEDIVTAPLLNKIAYVESGGNPMARAPTSSASGLFQFTNGTWKAVVDKYGAQTGISYRDKNNPQAQRVMADLMLKDNAKELQGFLGRNPNHTEVYLTHFLGVGGAKQLLSAHPNQLAFRVLPEAARSNRGIFYNNGRPRTVREVYRLMNGKINGPQRPSQRR